jgi:hypothetical protein
MRLHNGKIWLEYDGTDSYIARQLVKAGVPKEDIVLAFHPPDVRPHTGYAVPVGFWLAEAMHLGNYNCSNSREAEGSRAAPV